jgi:hypothetical protein
MWSAILREENRLMVSEIGALRGIFNIKGKFGPVL